MSTHLGVNVELFNSNIFKVGNFAREDLFLARLKLLCDKSRHLACNGR